MAADVGMDFKGRIKLTFFFFVPCKRSISLRAILRSNLTILVETRLYIGLSVLATIFVYHKEIQKTWRTVLVKQIYRFLYFSYQAFSSLQNLDSQRTFACSVRSL